MAREVKSFVPNEREWNPLIVAYTDMQAEKNWFKTSENGGDFPFYRKFAASKPINVVVKDHLVIDYVY